MKKIAILALSFAAMNTFAWEVNAKTGFDFARSQQTNAGTQATGQGWTFGLEAIPLDKTRVELGIGVESKFGVGTPFFNRAKDAKYAEGSYSVPLYALGKLNLAKSEDNNSSLYLLGRLGYAFQGNVKNEAPAAAPVPAAREEVAPQQQAQPELGNGLYYGAGVGTTVGPVVVEGLYDGTYRTQNGENKYTHNFGVRMGVRFGDYKVKKVVVEEPVVEETIVEEIPVVVVPVPVPVPVEKPVVTETKGLINAQCNESTNTCVIHGFAVDARTPNAEEQKNIADIANLVNDFAKSGIANITGYTDSTGSVAYNQKLSVERANSVAKLLRQFGLKDSIKFNSITGRGEYDPVDTNKTKQGRYNNRRVVIQFEDIQR